MAKEITTRQENYSQIKNADGSMTAEITTAAGEKAVLTLQRDENVIRALDAEGNVVAQRELDK